MIIKKLKPRQYERLIGTLMEHGQSEPLSPCYSVTLRVNGAEYIVKFQPEEKRRVAVLQALRVIRTREGHEYELITSGALLSAFAQIVLEQGAAKA